MKKFRKRFTDTQFAWLCYIPFGIASVCYSGWIGLPGSIFGWWLGGVLWNNQKAILNYNYRKFFKKHLALIINLLILIPIAVLSYRYGGASSLAAVIVGWIAGNLFWYWRKGNR